jgi:2-(1,2-epoxy-1,2-dihydrophenyl)acetyl-CoA isomerase
MTDWDLVADHPTLKLARREGAARVELHRPQALNAFDGELTRQFLATLRDLAADDTVRSVLITGAGRGFSAGADVKSQFSDPDARSVVEAEMRELTSPTIQVLRDMPKPVIAAVNGPAAGVGCSVALACDLVVAAESAFFLLAFANIGLTPDGGATLTVPARIGLGRAFVMALLADRVPAAEAVSWGLADRVVADDRLAEEAEALALRLAAGPTRAYAATKEAINAAQLAGLAAQLDREAALQGALVQSDDFAEGVSAFAARRSPAFRGA